MTIGELAARFDLAPHVLRHWESMGLLTPTVRVNGRRRYDTDHIARVAMIVRGKSAGMSLEQLAQLLRSTSREQRQDVLRRHHAELDQRLRQLEVSKSMIEHAMTCTAEDFTRCAAFRRLVAGISGFPDQERPS
ncbi:helix-turn-helix domain-containing protein [Nocardia amamiensis]|uniref:helix-turn-helix domain-containing protein n=1 Tax=Nocardia amamiensis TaxID=404578 RepID=UPI000A855FE1|nr:MerR family transcriptional regulator [Nocardia amamiensis]